MSLSERLLGPDPRRENPPDPTRQRWPSIAARGPIIDRVEGTHLAIELFGNGSHLTYNKLFPPNSLGDRILPSVPLEHEPPIEAQSTTPILPSFPTMSDPSQSQSPPIMPTIITGPIFS